MKSARLLFVACILLVFGVIYAFYIAIHPFAPRHTWLSVVIGDAATDLGASAMLWMLTRDRNIILIPWVAHALTGLPMILGQLLKHVFQDSGAGVADILTRMEPSI